MEALIKYMSLDTPMDLLHIIGKKRRDTGSIMRLFAEDMQQIGGVDVRHRFNQCFHTNSAVTPGVIIIP